MRSIEESLKSEQCRRILVALEVGPQTVDALAKTTKLTEGSVRKHANVLVLANLVSEDAEGRFSLTR
jgi:predicted transcriptional regulator